MRSGDFIDSSDILQEGPYPVYGGNGLRGFAVRKTHSVTAPLIGRQGALCGNINYASGDFYATEHAIVAAPRSQVHPRWLYWQLSNLNLNQYSMAAAQPGLAVEVLERVCAVKPHYSEQERIANFLDDKTARIDALIAEKERLVLAVREYFTARLGTAVVQGIRAERKLVEAHAKGFEAIPADWSLTPIKHLASASGGMTPSKDNDDFWQGDIPWVSPKDMKRFVLHDSVDHISQLALDSTSLKRQPVESVLVVVRGMILAHTFPVAINAVPVTINQDMKALHVKGRVSARYLAWMLRGLQPLMLALTEESAHGTKALRTDQWANQCVPVPPKDEQIELVQSFERWQSESEKLSAHLEQHIARLREYRSSLISAAVTGQLDIRTFKEAV